MITSAMYVKLRTWTGTQPPGCFYIQNKGLHAGRPLRKPIRNCFVVYSDDELLFEKVYCMFKGKLFERYIHGSVVPTICIGHVQYIIETVLLTQKDIRKELETIRSVEKLILNLEQQINLYRQILISICQKINGDVVRNKYLSQ
jgi:hypothetical protein